MPVTMSITVPDDLMNWLASAAAKNFRTPEGQLLWLVAGLKDSPEPVRASAARQLNQEIRDLQMAAGQPSIRAISTKTRQAGRPVSSSAVQDVLQGKKVPTWPMLEAVIIALGGDTQRFKELWMIARGRRI